MHSGPVRYDHDPQPPDPQAQDQHSQGAPGQNPQARDPGDAAGQDQGQRDHAGQEPDTLENVPVSNPPAVPPRGTAQPFVPPGLNRPAPSLSADPRIPVWIRRAVFALVIGTVVAIWLSWRWGVTAAAVVAIIDTIYQSKAMSHIPADARATSAQRRTRRRLMMIRAAGYVALHNRAIPGSDAVIDHLVIGPAGVFAIDSERWDRRLPVRTTGAGTGSLYHGPFSQSARLAHARWEAASAADLIGSELREEIGVSPVMVIYGPTIPWGVASLRGVAVFGGRRIRKYFRARNRNARGEHLSQEEIDRIYSTAEQVLPPAD